MGPFPCSFQRCKGPQGAGKKMGLTEQIDQARQLIKNSLECVDGLVSASGSSEDMALVKKLNALEVENKQLRSSPRPRFSLMSSPGTTRLTMTRCSPPSRALRWTDFSGAPTSSSPSATVSRSCK